MLKTRILLALISVLLIGGLFFLPKVVVDGGEQASTRGGNVIESPTSHEKVDAALLGSIASYRQQYAAESAIEKNTIFADSLSVLYSHAGRFDSAAWFAEQRATFSKTLESYQRAGEMYYQAFSFAMDDQKRSGLAEKCRLWFTKVQELEPNDLNARTKMAMTFLATGTPMQGIMMLREVLAINPKYEPALLNMGMLSMQSGQYDRAIERLQDLLKVNPEHEQGRLLLGAAYMNKGDKVRARELFEQVIQTGTDPSVKAMAEEYLKELN
ncbi:MAG: tetratricopeptide repeat protein [Cyclobacteriaceae bacterium]|nr:tetratricopeptide repeat protein [Cyclobacteriaceae bacterium]